MALALSSTDGNSNLCMGGRWNSPDAGADPLWGSPFSGATHVEIALRLKVRAPFIPGPTSTFRPNGMNSIVSCFTGSQYQSCFWLSTDGTDLNVRLLVSDGNGTLRDAATVPGVLIPGQQHSLVVWWDGPTDTFGFKVDGVDWAYSKGGTAITQINFNYPVAALEVGASSANDIPPVGGEYARVAFWTAALPALDRTRYCQGIDPENLSTVGRVKYVDLRPEHITPGYSASHWRTVDNWTLEEYGLGTMLYQYDPNSPPFLSPFRGVFNGQPAPDTEVVVQTPTVLRWWEQPQMLPQRGFEQWELMAYPGIRSSNPPRRVPEDYATTQSAMDAAQYGDIVDMQLGFAHAGPGDGYLRLSAKTVGPTTPRCPPRGRTPVTGRVPVTGHCPITGAVPVTGTSGDPSYILVKARAAEVNLPAFVRRVINLPNGNFTVAHDGPNNTSCRVDEVAHSSVMATIDAQGVATGGNYGAGFQALGWMFRGLKFTRNAHNGILVDLQPSGGWTDGIGYGAPPTVPKRILFNQCGWDTDPLRDGRGAARVTSWDGEFLGIINSFMLGMYGTPGSDNFLFFTSASEWGPIHVENNYFPLMVNNQSCFQGGGGINCTIEMQDNVWRRNHQVCPNDWEPSEINSVENPRIAIGQQKGWTVRVGGSGGGLPGGLTNVQYLSGAYSNYFGVANTAGQFSPHLGCTMYEPATGRARRISRIDDGGNGAQFLSLESDWPGGAGDFLVYFQKPQPSLLYNSGCDDVLYGGVMPTAIFTHGSVEVVLSQAAPFQIQPGQYLYPNFTHNEGGGDNGDPGKLYPTAALHDARDNSYSFYTGVTYANCRRKKIIDVQSGPGGGRRKLILENPMIILSGEPGTTGGGTVSTFPYSVVGHDGLHRPSAVRGKGPWEIKFGGSRMLWEGNIEENCGSGSGLLEISQPVTTGYLNPDRTEYWVQFQTSGYTMTATADTPEGRGGIATFSPDPGSGPLPPGGVRFGITGALAGTIGQRDTFQPRGWPTNGAETKWLWGAVTPENQVAIGSSSWYGPGRIVKRIIDSAHVELEPLGGLNPTQAFASLPTAVPYGAVIQYNPQVTIKRFTMRYNVFFRTGGKAAKLVANSQGELTPGEMFNRHDNVTILAGHYVTGMDNGGSLGTYGTWNISTGEAHGAINYVRVSHNTHAYVDVTPTGVRPMLFIGFAQPAKSHDIEFCDNLTLLHAAFTLAGSENGTPVDPTTAWIPPYRAARNVFAGPQAAAVVGAPTFKAPFPDNAAVLNAAAAGLPLYDPNVADLAVRMVIGQVDPMNLSPYRLQDVLATGTVSIDGTGKIVTLSSGTFPASVAPGAFFRAGAAALVQIQSVGAGTGPNWSDHVGHPGFAQSGGTASPVGGSAEAAISTLNTAVPGNQWARTILTSFSAARGFGIAVRMSAPGAPLSGYVVWAQPDGYYGPPYMQLAFGMWTSGVFSQGPVAGLLLFNQGDELMVEIINQRLTASINGVVKLDTGDNLPQYNSGRIGLYSSTNDSSIAHSQFTAGDYGGAGGSQRPLATELFSDPANSFVLKTAHPLAGQAALPFAVTFKGSGIDGGTPGADVDLVEQLIRNVRRASVFVADPNPPTIAITSPTTNPTIGVSTATITVGGTASDDVGVTFVSWTNDRGGSGTANGTTVWSQSGIVLQSGVNVLTFTAHDTQNITSVTLTVTYTPVADVVDPTCSITTNGGANFSVTGNTVALAGTSADNIGVVSVTWSNSTGGSGSATGLTSWTIPAIALASGANVITVTARDAAGNMGTDTITVTANFTADTQAPTVEITGPSSGAIVNTANGTATVSGNATDNVGVHHVSYIHYRPNSNDTGTATGTTAWSTGPLTLSPGSNTVVVTAFDAAGNASPSDSIEIIYQPTSAPPTITVVSPSPSQPYNTTTGLVTVTGTAADDVGVDHIGWTSNRGGSGTASGTTSWTASAIPLLPGTNLLTFTSYDTQDQPSTTVTLTVEYTPDTSDTTPPVVVITGPTQQATFATAAISIVLTGTATDANGVVVIGWSNNRGGTGFASGASGQPGASNFTTSVIALQPGVNRLTITALDPIGNPGSSFIDVTSTPVTVKRRAKGFRASSVRVP